jgi:ribosome-binding protein aMBF1 (putative translation factor)
MVNLPVQTVSDYESGKAIPNRQILSKFSRILGINLNKIK